jgi:AcrR family transcriptional regulator
MGKRREQILDAARRLIRATGGTDFPMRRLAEEAEVSLVTPYNLFGSKSGVLYALLSDSLERLDHAVDVRPSAKPVDAGSIGRHRRRHTATPRSTGR